MLIHNIYIYTYMHTYTTVRHTHTEHFGLIPSLHMNIHVHLVTQYFCKAVADSGKINLVTI